MKNKETVIASEAKQSLVKDARLLCLLRRLAMTLILVFSSSPLFADEAALLSTAHKQYEAGHYEEALKVYTEVAQTIPNGHVYYNIGNCYVRLGEIGKALFYYKKSQRLIPYDPELIANINYVRGLTKDTIDRQSFESISQKLFFWYYVFNFKTLISITIIINFLFFLFLFLRYLKINNEYLSWIFYVLFILNLIFISTSAVKYYEECVIKEGVVITDEIDIRSGFGITNSVLFKLHAGAEFNLLEENDGWVKIELTDGKKGWVSTKDVIYE